MYLGSVYYCKSLKNQKLLSRYFAKEICQFARAQNTYWGTYNVRTYLMVSERSL